jgi:hypothetical protein
MLFSSPENAREKDAGVWGFGKEFCMTLPGKCKKGGRMYVIYPTDSLI